MIVHKTIQFIYLYILFSNEKKISSLPFARHVRADLGAFFDDAVFARHVREDVDAGAVFFGGGVEALKIKQILSTCRQHHINR
jgi:hypothetical protein